MHPTLTFDREILGHGISYVVWVIEHETMRAVSDIGHKVFG